MSAYYVIPGSWRHLRDDYAHELHLQREAWRLRRWLWRAAYLREREEQERRLELADVAGWLPLAFDSLRTERDRLYRHWELWAWRAAYLREREARELARLRWLLEQHRLGAEERQTEPADEPFPDRARWLEAAADRAAAGEPIGEVMADYGWQPIEPPPLLLEPGQGAGGEVGS